MAWMFAGSTTITIKGLRFKGGSIKVKFGTRCAPLAGL
jgi:hypothetical protein